MNARIVLVPRHRSRSRWCSLSSFGGYVFSDVARGSSPASRAGVSPPANLLLGGTPQQLAGEDARATSEEAVSQTRSGAGSNQAAFTLIELMVVIALIGILSAMILPEMRGTYEEALLRSTSRQLVNLCHLAYSRAVSMQQVYRIVLDPISGKFVLEKRAPRARQGLNFVPAEDVAGSRGELDTRISIRFHHRTEDLTDSGGSETVAPGVSDSSDLGGRVVIGFYPDGTADQGEIQLRDRQGFGLLLQISSVTARVRISELPRE